MSFLGNILWLVFGGILVFAWYLIAGILMCVTIIGFPFGIQMFKLAGVALMPFGRDVDIYTEDSCWNTVFNILWLLLGWWEIALVHLALACICAITIVGLPFAKAHWRLMKMSLLPFGSHRIRPDKRG